MSLPQDRAANRERKAARIFGTTRVVRKKKDKNRKLPDAVPFEIGPGNWNQSSIMTDVDVVQLEVKNGMRRCPRVLVKALEQAVDYTPDAVPIAVFSDVGGTELACVPAKDLARWLGIALEKLVPKLPKKKRPKRPFKQLDLFEIPVEPIEPIEPLVPLVPLEPLEPIEPIEPDRQELLHTAEDLRNALDDEDWKVIREARMGSLR